MRFLGIPGGKWGKVDLPRCSKAVANVGEDQLLCGVRKSQPLKSSKEMDLAVSIERDIVCQDLKVL